uniref:DNA-directed RNA polymerase n=1 Tax=viral metagenome TaxID=1070528 RepID=A0A6C0ABX9_9ZZZZ
MDAEVYVYDDKIKPIDRVEFSIFPNEEKKKISAVRDDPNGIDIAELYDNVEPKRGGLIDPRLGPPGTDMDCATCGLNSSKCVGHFGHISLAEPIFHIGYLQIVKRILSCICLRCSKLLIHKNEKEIAEMLKNKTGKNLLNEVKNLTKNITHCSKANYGCGTPVSKIKIEINKTYVQILLVAEIAMAPGSFEGATEDEGLDASKRKLRQILSPAKVYAILSGISDTDCRIMGMDPTKSRPEDMIQQIFTVPPVQVRPSVKADYMQSSTMEDDLTHKLADIIKANIRIRKYKETIGDGDALMKYGPDQIQLLQFHGSTYFDNASVSLPKAEQKSKPIKSLSERLKGKEGRIRSNLMGKRVDYSARTVITPDPSLDMNQLGVPVTIAKNITFPEIVTPENINRLQALVKRGRNKYPGANFVFPISNFKSGKRLLPIDLRYREGGVDLRIGDVVERHIVSGDYVLLNRQPTLHKLSMMGHKVKILDDLRLNTFRLNPCVTTP